jgi:hypothetical protein
LSPAAGASAPPEAAEARSGPTGTLTIGGDTTFTFRVSRCDLSGRSPDNLLLRGNGTTADGRSFHVEVERMAPPAGVGSSYERVTLGLPPAEGNRRGSWEATHTLSGQGRWTSGPQSEPADGPLLQVDGAELVAEGTYHYGLSHLPDKQPLSADERRANRAIEKEARETTPGTLRATCVAPAVPAP